MKYRNSAIVFGFFAFCDLVALYINLSSLHQNGAAVGQAIVLAAFIGLIVFNIVRLKQSEADTGMVDKATGKKTVFTPSVRTKGVWVDDVNKLWQPRFTPVRTIYHFSDLKSFEIIKDRSSTSTYNSNRSSFAGTATYGSRRTTSTQISYLSLEIKLVNMQRLRWVVKLTNPHQAMADVEDTAELLQYIKDNQ